MPYYSTETSDVKTRNLKTLNVFKHVHYPNFLSSSSDLMEPYSQAFFSLWCYCQKVKRHWRGVWTLRHRSRLPLMHRSRVLFRMWIIWKIGAVILFKSNMTEKDISHAHTFHSLDCNFYFCTDFLHCWWLLKVKKINK